MSGMNGRGTSSSSALIESLVSGDRQGVGGILCNDPHGLCVATEGAPIGDSPAPQEAKEDCDAGVYTSLVRLAAQLQPPLNDKNDNTSAQQQQQQQQQQQGTSSAATAPPPLITLELPDKAILVKDYAGYAVTVQIPKTSATSSSSTTTGDGGTAVESQS